jgi:hypothetical protein
MLGEIVTGAGRRPWAGIGLPGESFDDPEMSGRLSSNRLKIGEMPSDSAERAGRKKILECGDLSPL